GEPGRNFDISVETASPSTLSLAIDDLVLGQETNGANSDGPDAGLVYTYTFTATDDSFQVALDDSPNGDDGNAVLAAVTLEQLGGDTTPPDTTPSTIGSLTPFTGGDAGEGLDLSGNIIYAFNLGGSIGTQTVQGVDFVDASVGAPPAGIVPAEGTLEFDYFGLNDGNAADYGTSADDDALEALTTVIWYNSNWTFDLATVPGTQYQLQLILQEGWISGQGTTIRNFDVSVETASPSTLSLGVDDLVLGIETNGAFQDGADFGLVYTYIFTAADHSFQVALDEALAGSLAVLAAVTLEELGADTTPPSITALDPVDDATGVPAISDLLVTFDEVVVFGTGNITIKESVGDVVVEAFDVTTSPNLQLSGTSVTIDPSANLAGTTGYYVQIDPDAIDDNAGNSFVGITDTTTWSFTTAAVDVTGPAVDTVDSPANGATEVSLVGSLALTFDEEVRKGAGNIVIRRTDDDTVVDTIDVTTAAVTVSGAQITFVPNVVLPPLTSLYVEIDSGAFLDLAGNSFAGISGSGTWNFTTDDTPSSLGSLTPFTGGDAGEGLDLSGNFVYAFNLGGAAQIVQGVTFVDASVGGPPAGIFPADGTLDFDYSTANPDGANGADYGDSANDDALEIVVNHVWYNNSWTFDLAVVPGAQYQLQLILQESYFPFQGELVRNFDISVETASPATLSLAIDDLVLGQDLFTPIPSRPRTIRSKWRWMTPRTALTETQSSLP
ncbi:MAG TPA: hypothetical protein EYQ50_05970, partial [Verrucomicrobiales bacterium]|nr:hypothetical protein [Verrucomicrobiales bacterium]